MARDNKKYVYLTIGILRGSETHKALLADAEEHNTKQLPTVAGIRLGEYYQLKQLGVLGTAAPVVREPVGATPVQKSEIQGEMIADEYADAMANAQEADDAWPE